MADADDAVPQSSLRLPTWLAVLGVGLIGSTLVLAVNVGRASQALESIDRTVKEQQVINKDFAEHFGRLDVEVESARARDEGRRDRLRAEGDK